MYGNSSNANELMAVIVANGLVSSIISTVLIILAIVGMWKMFRKAGKPGWAAIVPFYQTWVWGSVVFANKKKTIAWLVSEIILTILLCAIVGIALTSAPASTGSMYSSRVMTSSQIPVQMTGGLLIASLLFVIVGIVYTLFQLMALIATSWSFGKRDGFAVGLIFLEPIFLAIIGLSGSIRYVGPGGAPAEGDVDDQPSRALGDAYWQSEQVEEQVQAEQQVQFGQPQASQLAATVPPVMPSHSGQPLSGQPQMNQLAGGMPPVMPQSFDQAQPALPRTGQLIGEMPPVMPQGSDQPQPVVPPVTQLTGEMPPVMPQGFGQAQPAPSSAGQFAGGMPPVAVPDMPSSLGQPMSGQPSAAQLTGGMPPVMPPNPQPAEMMFAQQPIAVPAATMPAAVLTEPMPAWSQGAPQIQQPFAAAGQIAWQPTVTHGMAEPAHLQDPAAMTGELFQPGAMPGGFAAPMQMQPQAQPFDFASSMQHMLGESTQQASPLQPSWVPGQGLQTPPGRPD